MTKVVGAAAEICDAERSSDVGELTLFDRGAADLLRELAAFGPFFAVEGHPVSVGRPGPWRPMAELIRDPTVLADRILRVRQVLAESAQVDALDIQWRVAASTVHFGLVARLLAPTLARVTLTGRLSAFELENAYWQGFLGGAFALSLPQQDDRAAGGHSISGSDDGLVGELSSWIATGPIGQLTAAISPAGAVSRRVLWGNVGSAVHSAAGQITATRGDLDRVVTMAAAVGREGALTGTGRITTSGRYQRRSCCLIYRAAALTPTGRGRAVCGDCILGCG